MIAAEKRDYECKVWGVGGVFYMSNSDQLKQFANLF